MANERIICKKEELVAIADAIRDKNKTSDTYAPADMAQAILAIETGGSSSSGNIFSSTASGRIPEYEKGIATSVFAPAGLFTSTATGAVS